ncbi:MAG: molybdopterin-dependent oxidoreductase, partial [Cytophagales bacterium]|nr:molybdopterin-dependent oxidoreductase [Cytophagales bacterium]
MDRRHFIKASALAGGSLLLHFTGSLAGGAAPAQTRAANGPEPVPVNAFLRIGPDNEILFRVTRHEMGQGVATGLAMILAEELDADWEKVKLDFG